MPKVPSEEAMADANMQPTAPALLPSRYRSVGEPLSVEACLGGRSWSESSGTTSPGAEEASPSLSSSSATSASLPHRLTAASALSAITAASSSPADGDGLSSLESLRKSDDSDADKPQFCMGGDPVSSVEGEEGMELEEEGEATMEMESPTNSHGDGEASSVTVTDHGSGGKCSARSDEGADGPIPCCAASDLTEDSHVSTEERPLATFGFGTSSDDAEHSDEQGTAREEEEEPFSAAPIRASFSIETPTASSASLVGHSWEPLTPMGRKTSVLRTDDITMAADEDETAFHRVDSGQFMQQLAAKPKPKFKVIGPYLIGQLLGEGTFGKVKECVHSDTLHRWAVKIMKINAVAKKRFPDMEARIEREVRLIRRLGGHRNIIELREVVRRPDKPQKLYLIMEFCSGSLAEMLDASELHHFPEWQAHFYFRQLVAGLAFLQQQRIVHRDIKPGNLLVTAEEVLKISDFGEALELEDNGSDICKAGEGTPQFVAPEVASGYTEVRGFPLDVWAAGVTLYNLLFGTYPFVGDTLLLLYEEISQAALRLPEAPVVSSSARSLLSSALHKDPELRASLRDLSASDWLSADLPRPSSPEPSPAPVASSTPGVQSSTPGVPLIQRKLTQSYQIFRQSLDEDDEVPTTSVAPTEAPKILQRRYTFDEEDEFSDDDDGFSFSVRRKPSIMTEAGALGDDEGEGVQIKKSSFISQHGTSPGTSAAGRIKDAVTRRLEAIRTAVSPFRRTQSESALPPGQGPPPAPATIAHRHATVDIASPSQSHHAGSFGSSPRSPKADCAVM